MNLTQPRFSIRHAYWTAFLAGTVGIVVLGTIALGAVLRRSGTVTWPVSVATGLLAALPLALLAVAVVRRLREFRAYRHVPGPRPSFFLGNLEALLAQQHGGRDQALQVLHETYGPVVRLHLAWGSTPFVSLSRVSANLRRPDMDSNRRADRRVLPNSLMGMALGERQQRHRELANELFSGPAVRSGAERMGAVSRSYLDSWAAGRCRHGSLKSDLHHWSAHALGTFLCGDDWEAGGDLHEYLDSIAALEESISVDAFHPWFAKWISPARRARLASGYRTLFRLFARKIEKRRQPQSARRDDALGRLAEKVESWGMDECAEELITLVAGGTDAMSYTVSQALVLLSQHPEELHRLRRNLKATPQHVPHPAAVAVISEAMRLFPAVPFSSKVVPEGGVIEEGLPIPAGTNLMWMKTAVGRNPQVFHEPDRFLPSRFTGQAGPRESITQALPFGAGPRHCPGRTLAIHLCSAFLSSIVTRFDLQPIEVRDVKFSATVSVTPSTVPVRLVPRVRSESQLGLSAVATG